jgi:hypothetical protein
MKKYIILIVVCCITLLLSCKDEDEFGSALIYMPQATKNIGTDCNLPVHLVPSARADTSIVLGVYRSGLQKLEEVTVNLSINTDTIPKAKMAAQQPGASSVYNIYKTGVILPSQYYEPLPQKLTIETGNREAITYLVLKKSQILNNYVAGDILLLPVQIKDPTRYELNHSLSLTMVVITIGN